MSRNRILLVEDNADNRGLIRQVLENLDVELAEVDNGEDALSVARSTPPDLILMDLSLPRISGWAVTAALKADPATAGIPVVAVTAHAMEGDKERALAAGCDAYVTKPIDMDELLTLVEHHLEGAAAPVGLTPLDDRGC